MAGNEDNIYNLGCEMRATASAALNFVQKLGFVKKLSQNYEHILNVLDIFHKNFIFNILFL